MADRDSRAGSHFGPYRLKRLVGRGGMGDVYEAEDTVRERIVALKLMSDTLSRDPIFRARMQREARTAGRLQEPHVVPIHDYGEIDGQLYVDMRFIDGMDVATILNRSGPLSPPRAVAVVRQIGSALDAAHAAGVTHRDVKPENILVSADDFAYLVDFGIASANSEEKLTRLGGTVGTLRYMAPERFSEAEVTYRADIYALACVLYECLTGSPPYRGDQLSLMGAHLNQPIPRPSVIRPTVPVAFDSVIACGMAKDPGDRYATCGDLAAAAHAALARPDQSRATDILQRNQMPRPPFAVAGKLPDDLAPASPSPPQPVPQGAGWPPPPVAGSPVAPPGHQAELTTWAHASTWGAANPQTPSWTRPPPQPPRTRGKPWLWAGVAGTVVVTVVVGVGITLARQWGSSTSSSPPQRPSDAVELRVLPDGVFVGSSAAAMTIDIFNEPICPPCGTFIRSFSIDIDDAVDSKKLAVRFHLLNFLDSQSHSKNYSTRAVAATYCVAAQNEPKLYTNFYSALFDSDFQPSESGAADRTDGELANLANTFGASSTTINCINSGEDVGIAESKATKADTTLSELGATGTPFVWDGNRAVDYQDPNWLTQVLG
ncbi:serine/threonine protein kinase PknE [Mycobacterium sp.]|uniref:serine/threonine protein kinase PknE n=1 Tax=Mycobacterium sp. TaxID=1785 RepID=UPI003BACC84D